ncbi:CKLF-like MARVEL transmembrane domain-containing protein 8 [Clupea harengus]|uniref:CKLF-like MARVEL transmembrane domain-containing protein 8 n=1 Tax=Clupea harengus TaxID=7950 RepID=A0A6P3W4U0_CLUHA|nr:CKLF-like MARVEL transmembrane domain-containing protein 8 [Clupea harengus]
MEESGTSRTVINTSSNPYLEFDHLSTSTISCNKQFIRSASGLLVCAEVVLGLLVCGLIAGTDYFRMSPFGWVMFVAVFYWVLTLFLLLLFLTQAHSKIPQVPWNTVVMVFNSTATVLYLVAAVVEATLVSHGVKGQHNYNSWAASTFFAFLVSLCYAGSSFLSLRAWRDRQAEG